MAKLALESSPGAPSPDQRITLSKLYISEAAGQKLARISAVSGASAAVHRRRALDLYLDNFNEDGTAR